MRGWSVRPRVIERSTPICPAYAGMILWFAPVDASPDNLSRVCGDDPLPQVPFLKLRLFVPRMRGWSLKDTSVVEHTEICPAYAGMILLTSMLTTPTANLSRVCGDDPLLQIKALSKIPFVPRMRGWSCWNGREYKSQFICPAYAGMIPLGISSVLHSCYLSRVCGDDPFETLWEKIRRKFVPRMRGWSPERNIAELLGYICPAYAGMIPDGKLVVCCIFHLSRVCGDDPTSLPQTWTSPWFVPRMRGWSHIQLLSVRCLSICPAYAGMILFNFSIIQKSHNLSRVCGDDPWMKIEIFI